MEEEQQQEVVIVGAGIAGLATALALKRVGIKSVVLERASELRATGAAITLFSNGWRALDALGVAHKLAPLYPPYETGLVTNLVSGAVQEFSYTGTTKRARIGARTLHRKVLLKALADELSPDTIRFSSKLVSIKTLVLSDSSTVILLQLEDGALISAKVLIGCDGVNSVVAQWLGLTAPRNSGRSSVRGLSIYSQGHGLKLEGRIFLEHGKRAGFIPLNDTDLYWFTTHITTAREKVMASGDPTIIQREVFDYLAKGFPEEFLQKVRDADLSTVSWAPLMYRVPWNLIFGKTYRGSIVVAGDAMHPMTPDLIQGGGAALEDAIVLTRKISGALNARGAICAMKAAKGIEEYAKERRWRVAGLVLGSSMSGWVQLGGSGLASWVVRWFRDHVFYKFIQPRINADIIEYDCGVLHSAV